MSGDTNYFVHKILFKRFYETPHSIKWIREDSQRPFCLPFPLNLTPSCCLPQRCENPDPGYSALMMVLGIHLYLKPRTSVFPMSSCYLWDVACACAVWEMQSCREMLRIKELWGLGESFAWFSCQREQRRCYLFPEFFVPGVPPQDFYLVVWENIPWDSVNTFLFCTRENIGLVQNTSLGIVFLLSIKITYC